MASRVPAIEYQGYFVKVMLDAGRNADFVVYMSERKFFPDPDASATSFRRPGRSRLRACFFAENVRGRRHMNISFVLNGKPTSVDVEPSLLLAICCARS